MYTCASCRKLSCDSGDLSDAPQNCPSTDAERADDLGGYQTEPERTLAREAARVEAAGYCRLTRVQEIMDFARRCGFEHLGIAFCIGLRREAEVFARILRANGFAVDSVACKNGSHSKETLGLTDAEKVESGTFEPMCNPLGQARCLQRAGTQLNVMLGLCVGHDALFMSHSHAPVTVLAAKDRVLGHNPLAALYTADGYYRGKLFPAESERGSDAAGARQETVEASKERP